MVSPYEGIGEARSRSASVPKTMFGSDSVATSRVPMIGVAPRSVFHLGGDMLGDGK